MLLVSALWMTTTACSDQEPTVNSRAASGKAAGTHDDGAGTTASGTVRDVVSGPEDGRLTTATGKVITNFGDRALRIAAVRTLDRLQHDFRAGRMTAACRKINSFMLSQFTPSGTQGDTPCSKKLEAYAAARARRGDQPKRLRLLWVRAYTGEAGVWVEEPDGRRTRIQLTDPFSSDGWQLDLGAHNRGDLLAAELIGADNYAKR